MGCGNQEIGAYFSALFFRLIRFFSAMFFYFSEPPFLRAIKIGLWASVFIPLVATPSLIFPYTSGKGFLFRLLVEAVFIFWIILLFQRREYRPRFFSPLVVAASVFVAAVFLADVFSPNPAIAFFSGYERMGGFTMTAHLYVYFLMLASVFRERRDWIVFFRLSVAASVVVSLVALFQKLEYLPTPLSGVRPHGTIGNPAHFAAYLLFHIWILAMFLYEAWQRRARAIFYGALMFFEVAMLYFAASRGAVLALLGSLVFFFGALAIFRKAAFPSSVVLQRVALGAAAALVVLPLIFAVFYFGGVFPDKFFSGRIFDYSLENETVISRLSVWKMAWQGFLERPIFGWGQENFYLIFQKYFDPRLYGQEPWFDRAHSVFFDTLVEGGALGLAAYLGIFAVLFYVLWKGIHSGAMRPPAAAALGALFVAYFAQGLFTFDGIPALMLFFALLGYVAASSDFSSAAVSLVATVRRPRPAPRRGGGALWPPHGAAYIAAAVILIGAHFLNIVPIQQARVLAAAVKMHERGIQFPLELERMYRKALGSKTWGDREARERLALSASVVAREKRFYAEDRKRFVDFAVEELKKEIERDAVNVKHLHLLGMLLNEALDLNPAYAVLSEETLVRARRINPVNQAVSFELAELYIGVGRQEEAAAILRTMWDLDPWIQWYRRTPVDIWYYGILADMPDVVEGAQRGVRLDSLGAKDLERLSSAYRRVDDFAAALPIQQALVLKDPENAFARAVLAALLAYAGRIEEAKLEAREAARVDPSFAREAELFIRLIETGNATQLLK